MPRIFSQSQSQNLLTLQLTLTENAGCFVPHLSMEGEAFRLKMNLI